MAAHHRVAMGDFFVKGPVLKSFMRQAAIDEDHDAPSKFGFYKMCLKSWYLQLETKKKYVLFLKVFRDFLFFLEIFTTLLTMQCPKCLFHIDNHIDQIMCVTFVEKVPRWNSA